MRQDALTALVQEQVGDGRLSVRAFAEIARDPETGYSPGKSLIGKIVKGQTYVITPELVSALAAGLGRPRDEVARAAARQFLGYMVEDPGIGRSRTTVRVARRSDESGGSTGPLVREFVDEELGGDERPDR